MFENLKSGGLFRYATTGRLHPARLMTGALLLAGVACERQPLTAPVPLAAIPVGAIEAHCVADRVSRTVVCGSPSSAQSPGAANFDKIIGGQDVNVKLASSGTAYNSGTAVFSTSVTVQNFAQLPVGTTDGTTVAGVKVFFERQPTVLSGSGTITIANPDGTGTFTGTGQPFYAYSQILNPYEISSSKQWLFNVPATVNTFDFTVYVSAPTSNDMIPVLDRVWAGLTSSDWFADANWKNGAAPVATSTVAIPSDSLLAPGHAQPALSASTTIANLRVGFGTTLNLGANTLTATGNVDSPGTITNGRVTLTGTTARIAGNFSEIVVQGSVSLQSATMATAAVSVTDGALTVADKTLSIQIP